jgi:hypothetical protein
MRSFSPIYEGINCSPDCIGFICCMDVAHAEMEAEHLRLAALYAYSITVNYRAKFCSRSKKLALKTSPQYIRGKIDYCINSSINMWMLCNENIFPPQPRHSLMTFIKISTACLECSRFTHICHNNEYFRGKKTYESCRVSGPPLFPSIES